MSFGRPLQRLSAILLGFALPALGCAARAADGTLKAAYDLKLADGVPIIQGLTLQGVPVRAGLDSGSAGGIFVSPQIFQRLHVMDQQEAELEEAVGYHKAAKSNYGEVRLPLLGSGRKKWFTVSSWDMADENGDIDPDIDCTIPLTFLEADYCIFLLSRKQLLLTDLAPSSVKASVDVEEDYPLVKSIPYYESETGLFVDVYYQGTDSLAYLDTGAYITVVSEPFIAAHPEMFEPSNHPSTLDSDGEALEESDYDYPAYRVTQGLTLRGIDQEDDTPLDGIFQSLPGGSADKQDKDVNLGMPSFTPYNREIPSLSPVLSIGMDVLGKYDFMFDQSSRMLYLWNPDDTPKMFPEAKRESKGSTKKRHRGKKSRKK